MRTFQITISLLIISVLAAVAAQAQAKDEQPAHPPLATVYGNTGLWRVFSADNLPQHQVAFNVWYDRINRNPGFLTISTVGVSGAVGITDWLELGMNFEINKRILARRQDQLSFGQQALGFFGNKTPGSPPLLTQLMPGSNIMPQLRFPATPMGVLGGTAGYFNNLPWVGSSLQGNGVGTVTMGIKLNPLSEERGNLFGLSFRGYAVIPTHRATAFLLNRPVQTGDWSFGSDIILSKYVGDIAELDLNAGYRAYQGPGESRQIQLSDEVPLGFGITIPRKTRLQVMAEVNADVFVGDHTPSTSFGPRDPVDGTIGFRAWLTKSLALSGGYRHPFNQTGGDKNGFIADLSYGTAKKIIPPPPQISLTCSADPSQVNAGETVKLSARAEVSDGSMATYAWSTTGGTIEGSGATPTLRTDNLNPGTYTVTVRATDGPRATPADCTASVTVRTPPPAPKGPVVTCSTDKATVVVGEIVTMSVQASSPDNRPLTYQWTSTGGRVEGTGNSARFDSTGLQPGRYTIKVTVTDDRGLSADCSREVTVEAPPPPKPAAREIEKLGECKFTLNRSRVDNFCKEPLDRAAVRLKNEGPQDKLVVVGFARSSERRPTALADARAGNGKAYLVEERGIGISESRVETRRGDIGRGTDLNRLEIYFVPSGQTMTRFTAIPYAPTQHRTAATGAARPRARRRAPAKKTTQTHTGNAGAEVAAAAVAEPANSVAERAGAERVIIVRAR